MNIGAAIRTALLGDVSICAKLGTWEGYAAVFNRRPIPATATPANGAAPWIICADTISVSNADFLRSRQPVVQRQVAIYGVQPDHYRAVEDLGWLVRQKFHRVRTSLDVTGYHVVEVVADGPIVGPTEDESLVARIVTLTVRLQDLA